MKVLPAVLMAFATYGLAGPPAIGLGNAPNSTMDSDPFVLTVPVLGTFGDCVDCTECVSNGQVGHKAYPGDNTSVSEIGGGSHSSCVLSGTCNDQHPISSSCVADGGGGGGDYDIVTMSTDLEKIRAAVLAGEFDLARRIADSPNNGLKYVSERNAVQATGCRGQIIVHLVLI